MSLPRPLEQMKEEARRDDWHLVFVASDIRQLIGEIDRLRIGLREIYDDTLGDKRVRHNRDTAIGFARDEIRQLLTAPAKEK